MGCGLTFNAKKEFVDKIEEFEVLVDINVEWVAKHGTDRLPKKHWWPILRQSLVAVLLIIQNKSRKLLVLLWFK